MQKAIKLENISNLIASPSSYQCRKTRLVHFIIHGRNTSMERMCAHWGIPKGTFSKQMKKKLSYKIIRIKRIFSGVFFICIVTFWVPCCYLRYDFCIQSYVRFVFTSSCLLQDARLLYVICDLFPLSDVQRILCCVFSSCSCVP
jgi:hypothetical protein